VHGGKLSGQKSPLSVLIETFCFIMKTKYKKPLPYESVLLLLSSQGSLLKTFKYIGKSNWITTRKQATGIVFNPLDELDY
jgi:hypothetical protein